MLQVFESDSKTCNIVARIFVGVGACNTPAADFWLSCWDHLETLSYMLALRSKSSLNSKEGTISLNVILPMACSKLYRESGPNKMAPMASILLEREQ